MARTLIVSDVHLGASNSQTAALDGLLRQDYDRFILNGDTLDHLNFRRFRPEHWATLEKLKAIARERKLILIRGNHESMSHVRSMSYGPLDILAEMLGVEMREELEMWVGRRRYLIHHGDVYDPTLHAKRLTAMADEFYRMVQRCSRPGARWLKMRVKHWGGVVDRVRTHAVRRAKEERFQGVIVGHVHFAEDTLVEGIHYLNTGCWVEQPCTYVEADEYGIRLRTYGNDAHWGSATEITRSYTEATCQGSLVPAMA